MAVVQGEFYSEALGMNTKIAAILPEEAMTSKYGREKRYPTLYMLHGALWTGFHTLFGTNIEANVSAMFPELVVIMPSANFSFYTDYVKEFRYAHQYRTFIADELVDITRKLFPLSDKREETAIYGHSMGGFGAYGAGLNHPETFGYVGSQSGMVDIGWAVDTREFMRLKHERMFGKPVVIKSSEHDYYKVSSDLAAGNGPKPSIFQCWGEKDYLRDINEKMYEHMKTLNLDYTAYRIPEGYHSWGIDNKNDVGIRIFLKWLKEKMLGVKDLTSVGEEVAPFFVNDYAQYEKL